MKNITIDHKILAKHFNHTDEGMRKLKRKHEKDGSGLWSIYVKAYNWDKSESDYRSTIEEGLNIIGGSK